MKTESPKAQKKDHVISVNNHQRRDPYFWMNQRDHKDVVAYINAENNFANEYFKNTKKIQTELLDEFDKNIDPNDKGAPFYMDGNWFQRENNADQEYSKFYRLEKDKKFLYLDENERALNHSYYNLASWTPSPNNKILALGEDFTGRRQYKISFRENSRNTYLEDIIENTDGSVVWSNDNAHVFYVKKDAETLREFQVYRHKIGTSSEKDECIFEELDERFYVYISKSKDNKHIQINLYSSTKSESYIIDANNADAPLNLLLKREKDHLYDVESFQDGFLMLSNKNAPNNTLSFYPNSLSGESELIIAHREDILLEEFTVFNNHIVIVERELGLRKIRIIDWTKRTSHFLEINEECYSLSLFINEKYDSSTLYYAYNSLTTPAKVIKYNMDSCEESIHFEKGVPNEEFNASNYISERTWALANDGSKIAVSLVRRKDTEAEKAPLLLYAYGSYGITIPTGFSAYRLSLLDRGFVFAIAHIRGGKYLGEEWYQNGKFLKKKNTFTDFINCAEHLLRNNFCKENGLYAQGGSAGGMLMGTVVNMAPYLFKGIIAQVPFVDVVTTMLDESIPLTVGEFEEWGNPKEEDYYQYMLSYSPYDNVRAMHYPSMFVSTGYHDSQVQYWEPLKWIAKLREFKQDDNPLIFKCNMDAGHSGGSGRSTERKEIAENYAYLLKEEGIV